MKMARGIFASSLDNISLRTKVVMLAAVPIAIGLFFILTLHIVVNRAREEAEWENHVTLVISDSELLAVHCNEIQEAFVNLCLAKTSDESDKWKANFNYLTGEIPRRTKDLEHVLRADTSQSATLSNLKNGTEQEIKLLRSAYELLQSSPTLDPRIRELQLQSQDILHSQISTALVRILSTQSAEAKANPPTSRKWRDSIDPLLLGGMVLYILTLLLAGFISENGLIRRLSVVVDNAQRLASKQVLNPPLRGRDEIATLDAVFNDMARKIAQAARKERAILDNALDVICSIDQEGNFTAVNPACLSAWGYSPEELIGTPFIRIISADDRGNTLQSIKEISSADNVAVVTMGLSGDYRLSGKKKEFENRIICKNGTELYTLWSMHWSSSEGSLFCVIHDLTERHQIEQLKQEFVAMVSHDLRTPLSSIQGFLELLAEGIYGQLSAHGIKRASLAERDAQRLMKLITNILDMERMSSGKLQMELESVGVDEMIERSIEAVRGVGEKREVAIEFTPTDLAVEADRDRIIQVIINFLSNAIKFSPKGSAITVSSHEVEADVEIRVTDRGRGIPEEYRTVIFERFKQVEIADEKVKKGTGLGLAICKAIVQQHGGAVGVQSEIGKGSTFWLRLKKMPRCETSASTSDDAGVIELPEHGES